MSCVLKRALWLLACVLAALLCLFFLPLGNVSVAWWLAAILMAAAIACWRVGRTTSGISHQDSVCRLLAALPAASWRQPVVLTCGDNVATLFAEEPVRCTPQGCFICVSQQNEMSALVAAIIAARPDWSRQISVLLTLFPEQQRDQAVMTAKIREFRYQVGRVAQLTACHTPVLIAGYLDGDISPWFELQADSSTMTVWGEEHAAVGMNIWLTEGDAQQRAARLQQTIAAAAWQRWMVENILHECRSPELVSRPCYPIAMALTFLPQTPQANNLWTKWLIDRTTLPRISHSIAEAVNVSPFPDAMLRLLPHYVGHTPHRRAAIWGIGLLSGFVCLALVSSVWNNLRLWRQIRSDLQHYQVVDVKDHSAKVQAYHQLKLDATLLEKYQRDGEPVRLGLGLYVGERLYTPLMDVINRAVLPVSPPPVPKSGKPLPQTLNLRSMSLFDVGQSGLKPEAAKVLVNALIDIKAKPGWMVVITGHTDSTGDAAKNRVLSLARAEAVRDWILQTSDVSPACLVVKGEGATRPIAANTTAAGRAVNRRVEISLMPPSVAACQRPQRETRSLGAH
ncbi:OmpA family protein [Photorhabdus aegyptia]|uniref:Outer membrane protein/peptidoglycan-associated (Lipo)protein n=1 Tax=Photorhabdus aegyptia TaxID=2805098 RepID=A0A022PB45_9GAMM|nr:OmpA family protein [Photorhabdus aegyptia]EYU13397.1 outer membrane protein/peptidoglycan-associated (lipo)protein [Photorhabdus aegyptia]